MKYKIGQETQNEISFQTDSRLDGRFYILTKKHNCFECLFGCLCESKNIYFLSETNPNF